MKVYLAGPMRGIPEYNFSKFHAYAALVRARGHKVFNPAEIWFIPQTWIRCIFAWEFLWIALWADSVALIPGWQKSRGATAERAFAIALGLEVIEL